MNKKKIICVVVGLALIVLLVFILSSLFSTPVLNKSVAVRGYEINIPKKWSSDSKGNIYDKRGYLVGSFSLIDDEEMLKFNSTGEKVAENITKYNILEDSIVKTIYHIENLPNPEPYGAQIVFYDEYVKERLADKIVKSFRIPKIGTNPPMKNIKMPDEENSVIKIEFKDESVTVKNSRLFAEFSEKRAKNESYGISVVSYKDEDGKRTISSLKYLECDVGVCYIYTYYDNGEGMYTYDNNPIEFYELYKRISEEKSTTSYFLKINDGEDIKLIDFPLNRYRDNAKELIELKTDNAKSADIQNILDKILSNDERKKMSFHLNGNALDISFDELYSDKATAYSHAAILFSLAGNVDEIKFSYIDEEFIINRNEINNDVDGEVDSVADDEKTFVDYTEKIEDKKNNSTDGVVVYSGTITISYDTLVTHPKNGKKVKIGPYAEKYGYKDYIGKPISCVIKTSGSGYVMTANCGGKTMAYPLENEARLKWAMNIINSYS